MASNEGALDLASQCDRAQKTLEVLIQPLTLQRGKLRLGEMALPAHHQLGAKPDPDPRLLAHRPRSGQAPPAGPELATWASSCVSVPLPAETSSGGREGVLCEPLKSETRKELRRNLKQDELTVFWPQGSRGLAGLCAGAGIPGQRL